MRLERYELMLEVWRREGNYQAKLLDFSGGVSIMIIRPLGLPITLSKEEMI